MRDRLVSIIPLGLALLAWAAISTAVKAKQLESSPDPRLILQTQAGLSAYAQITATIPIALISPIYAKVDYQDDVYILGDYALSGRTDRVKLIAHRDGWALAYQPRGENVSQFFDCYGYPYTTNPAYMPNRLETAIKEVSTAMGITTTVPTYYDFRNPQADHIILHWLLQMNFGQINSVITPTLFNTYYERGFGLCTVTYYGELYLNNALIVKGTRQFIFGLLDSSQFRVGQANAMAVLQRPVIGTNMGLMGGVAMVYSGSSKVSTSGGYRRVLSASYPSMIGPPVTISSTYLPVLAR